MFSLVGVREYTSVKECDQGSQEITDYTVFLRDATDQLCMFEAKTNFQSCYSGWTSATTGEFIP